MEKTLRINRTKTPHHTRGHHLLCLRLQDVTSIGGRPVACQHQAPRPKPDGKGRQWALHDWQPGLTAGMGNPGA